MRKRLTPLCCAFLLCCSASGALALTVPCPEAHLTLTVPDSWTLVPLEEKDDPGLCLLLETGEISLSVYIDETGGLLPDTFQVFTGDETETSVVHYGGVEMTCVAGRNDDGTYRIYTWLDEKDQVQFWFLITGSSGSGRGIIEDIMGSIQFD